MHEANDCEQKARDVADVRTLARIDDVVAGFLMANVDRGDFGRHAPVAVIDTLGVDPNYAGRGPGRAMLSRLMVNLAALRVERVETVVSRMNFDVLSFFYKAGFRAFGAAGVRETARLRTVP